MYELYFQLKKAFENEVVAKAWEDADLHDQLLADPRGTLDRLGHKVPSDVKLRILEEEEDTLTLVLPRNTRTHT